MNPNKVFKRKKLGYDHPYDSPRPYKHTLLIRCDECGWKLTIPREVWIGKEPIVCKNCLEEKAWSTL